MCLGIPAKIIQITDKAQGLACVETDGVSRTVNVGLLTMQGTHIDALIGRWVLIHVGFAMAVIDEQEALSNLAVLKGFRESDDD